MAQIGRPEKPKTERTVKLTVSVPFWIAEFLKKLGNRSEYITKAIAQKIERDK